MASEQIHVVVRKPLSDIEQDIRRKFGVRSALADVSIEEDALVFTFDGQSGESLPEKAPTSRSPISVTNGPRRGRRRKHRVRKRMKTRGWDVAAKFVNSRGQSCTIYRPFLEALSERKLTRREGQEITRELLVSNGNSPKPSSVEYFLNNTLEYIESRKPASRTAAASEEGSR